MRYFGYMFLFGNICAKNLGLVDDAARCFESPVWGRPVRGNGKIVQELEGDFRGAGWNVIKLLWGKGWDELLETAQGLSRLSYSFLGPSVMDGLPSGSRDALFGGGVRIEKPLVALRTERENDRPCQLCMT